MRFLLRSGKSPSRSRSERHRTCYESVLTIESKVMPGVRFIINRISFGRRMDLSKQVREISRKMEFLEAANEVHEKLEARILAQEVEAAYLRWGLVGVYGLTIDGEEASAAQILEKGPEELAREIVGAIKHQCGLSEEERKN